MEIESVSQSVRWSIQDVLHFGSNGTISVFIVPALVIREDSLPLNVLDISSDVNGLNVFDMSEGEGRNPYIENLLTAGPVSVPFPRIAERIAVLITVLGISKANCESTRRR